MFTFIELVETDLAHVGLDVVFVMVVIVAEYAPGAKVPPETGILITPLPLPVVVSRAVKAASPVTAIVQDTPAPPLLGSSSALLIV